MSARTKQQEPPSPLRHGIASWLVAAGPLLALVVYSFSCIQSPGWSPDEKRLAYVLPGMDEAPDSLWVTNVNSGKHRLLLTSDAFTFSVPRYSPDGRKLAFFRQQSEVENALFEFCVMKSDGRDLVTLTSFPLVDSADEFLFWPPASWSKDAKQVAVVGPVEDDSDRHNVYVVNVETGERTILAPDAAWPAWSPDGRWIAVLAEPPKDEETQEGQQGEELYLQIYSADSHTRLRSIQIRHDTGEPLHTLLSWTRDSTEILVLSEVYSIDGIDVPTDACCLIGLNGATRFVSLHVAETAGFLPWAVVTASYPNINKPGFPKEDLESRFLLMMEVTGPLSWSVSPRGRRCAVWLALPGGADAGPGGLWITDFRNGDTSLFLVRHQGDIPLAEAMLESAFTMVDRGRLRDAHVLIAMLVEAIDRSVPGVDSFPCNDEIRMIETFLDLILETKTDALIPFFRRGRAAREMRRWDSREMVMAREIIRAGEKWSDGRVRECREILATVPGTETLIAELDAYTTVGHAAWKNYQDDMLPVERRLFLDEQTPLWLKTVEGQHHLAKAIQEYLNLTPTVPNADHLQRLLDELPEYGHTARALGFLRAAWDTE